MKSSNDKEIQKILRDVKIAAVATLVLVALLSTGAAVSLEQETTTLSDDAYTVANSTDGETLTVEYEIVYSETGTLTDDQTDAAIDAMDRAAVCANGELDRYIESHTSTNVTSEDLDETVTPCETDEIEINVID